MRQFDAFLLRKLQDIYLWFYDWTGVYAASIAACSVIIGSIAVGLTITQFIALFFCLVILIPYYLDQDKANYKVYNARAMLQQQSTWRFIMSNVFLFIAIPMVIVGVWAVVNTIAIWLYINIAAVCIREREPKEWFKKQELARENS